MNATPVWISEAARSLHPRLSEALRQSGVELQQSASLDATALVSAGEPVAAARFVRLGRTGVPALSASPEPGCCGALSFDGDDRDFAAALIAAMACGNGPVAAAPASQALLHLVTRVAARDVSVLITGGTGTGKEVLANYIHQRSPRCGAGFVAVNCAALPEAMLEALLFGHERGAFTGASASAKGLFRAADGGTLLLDEVTELPLPLQAKLLRVLQEQEVLPIGATVAQKIDVRVIACSNRNLASEVAAGRFRADLFYRLAVFPLTITPLATRPADIVPIAAALWRQGNLALWPTAAALRKLAAHHWPGNVRELGNVLQRAGVYALGPRIEAGDIVFDADAPAEILLQPASLTAAAYGGVSTSASLGGIVREHEFAAIRSALADCSGRRLETARRLGISERTLRYKMVAMSGGLAVSAAAPAAAAQAAMTMQ